MDEEDKGMDRFRSALTDERLRLNTRYLSKRFLLSPEESVVGEDLTESSFKP